MKISFFETEQWQEPIIRENFPEQDVFVSPNKIVADSLPEKRDAEVLCVFVNSRIDAVVLDAFPAVKYIATRSTGYDHIDIPECTKRGIAVLSVPGYGDNTVAEFAFGLLLNLTRKIYAGIDQIKETGSFVLGGLRGVDLKGKTMGIIGTGRIGKESIKIAKGFGMRIIAYDPYPDAGFAAAMEVSYMDLAQLLGSADFISLHCPYNASTHHLINKTNIGSIKRGAYLVNTARGALVETDALVEALEQGILAGYGTDVLEEEGETKDEMHFLSYGHPKEEELRTILENHVLMKMPAVLITPHNAFNTQEALERILHTTVQNIQSCIAGAPVNVVKQ